MCVFVQFARSSKQLIINTSPSMSVTPLLVFPLRLGGCVYVCVALTITSLHGSLSFIKTNLLAFSVPRMIHPLALLVYWFLLSAS